MYKFQPISLQTVKFSGGLAGATRLGEDFAGAGGIGGDLGFEGGRRARRILLGTDQIDERHPQVTAVKIGVGVEQMRFDGAAEFRQDRRWRTRGRGAAPPAFRRPRCGRGRFAGCVLRPRPSAGCRRRRRPTGSSPACVRGRPVDRRLRPPAFLGETASPRIIPSLTGSRRGQTQPEVSQRCCLRPIRAVALGRLQARLWQA